MFTALGHLIVRRRTSIITATLLGLVIAIGLGIGVLGSFRSGKMSGRLDGTARTYSSGKSNTEPSSSSTFGSGAFLNASTTTISPLRPAPSTLALDARTRTGSGNIAPAPGMITARCDG